MEEENEKKNFHIMSDEKSGEKFIALSLLPIVCPFVVSSLVSRDVNLINFLISQISSLEILLCNFAGGWMYEQNEKSLSVFTSFFPFQNSLRQGSGTF